MKKSLFVVAAMMMTTAVIAQTRPGFELGAQVLDYGLRQRDEGELVEQDDARFSGLTVGYTKVFRNGVFVGGDLTIGIGSADIKSEGVTQLRGVDQGVGKLEFHAGRDFALGARTTISPFAGFGVRVLTDDSGGRQTEEGAGFDRRTGWRYVPLGAAATFALPRNATLTLTGQYNWLLDGHAESDLSQVDPAFPDVNLRIDGGSGYEIGAMLGIPLASHRLSVGPFLRKWNVERSKPVTLPGGFEFFEPRSRSTEAGVRVSFGF